MKIPANLKYIIHGKAGEYFVVATTATMLLMLLTRFYLSDLFIPLFYSIDAPECLARTKDIFFNDYTRSMFAPFGYADSSGILKFLFGSVSTWLIHLIGLLTAHNVMLTTNIYYLLTFVLIAATAFHVLRSVEINFPVALTFAILYTFLPFHFMRNMNHLQYSSYYMVPLTVMVLLWLHAGHPIFFKQTKTGFRLNVFNPKAVATVMIIFVFEPVTYYFPYYVAFLALVTGIATAIDKKHMVYLGTAVLIIFLAAGSIYKLEIPEIVTRTLDNGRLENAGVVTSQKGISHYGQDDIYGLKMVLLLLPANGHRLAGLQEYTDAYMAGHTVNENLWAALGLVGAIGFMALLVVLVISPSGESRLFRGLALLNISAVLFATIGGFASFISTLIYTWGGENTPLVQARAHNRISVFIAFFAFMLLALLVNAIIRKYGKPGPAKTGIVMAACVVLGAAGLYDQVPPAWAGLTVQSPEYQKAFRADETFFKQIEADMPDRAMIFQLPVAIHHVGSDVLNYTEYLKPYLHTKRLKWTYGGDKDSAQVQWYQNTANAPVTEMLERMALYGFSGILYDTHGISENLVAMLATGLMDRGAKRGPRHTLGRYLFFDIRPVTEQLLRAMDQKDILRQRADAHTTYYVGIGPDTPHQIGRYVPDPAGGYLQSVEGERGYLLHGSYTKPAPGRYTVTFEIETHAAASLPAGTRVGIIDVFGASHHPENNKQYAQQPIRVEPGIETSLQSLSFEIHPEDENYFEFRLFAFQNCGIKIRKCTYQKVEPADEIRNPYQ